MEATLSQALIAARKIRIHKHKSLRPKRNSGSSRRGSPLRGLEAHQNEVTAIVMKEGITDIIIDRSGANPLPREQRMIHRSTMIPICQIPPQINTWIQM
jgi:hypothetical protein